MNCVIRGKKKPADAVVIMKQFWTVSEQRKLQIQNKLPLKLRIITVQLRDVFIQRAKAGADLYLYTINEDLIFASEVTRFKSLPANTETLKHRHCTA